MSLSTLQALGNGLPAPVPGPRLHRLHEAVRGFSGAELLWASGYLAGLSNGAHAATGPSDAPSALILYASQTGNAAGVAKDLARQARALGLAPRLVSSADFRPRDLTKERLLLLVTSTHGEGEPPETAVALHRYLDGERAPRLERLSYGVFGLGDSSYPQFCQAARDFDRRLHALGARRVLALREADLDFEPAAAEWSRSALEQVRKVSPLVSAQVPTPPAAEAREAPSRARPYSATLVESRRLSTEDAVTEVRHLALEVEPGVLELAPGDSLGVWFRNDPALVARLLGVLGIAAGEPVDLKGDETTIAEALEQHLEITRLHPLVVREWAALSGAAELHRLAGDDPALRRFALGHQLLDLVQRWPARPQAAALAALLRPLTPRLYSIASSPLVHDDEVHLTVATRRQERGGEVRLGGASGHLNRRLAEGEQVRVYVSESPGFHLPEDGSTPLILIGTGTGIAPFRAFLQHRAASVEGGEHWLIYGNRHFHRDFLYQLDWLEHRKAGRLQRVDLAFSRDGSQRRLVQDRIREQGRRLREWLARGAHLYVCGGEAMGEGVQAALIEILAKTSGDGVERLEQLRAEGRYHRDTY